MSESPGQNQNLFERIEEQETAAREFGFYWERLEQLIDQIQSECTEIHAASQKNDRAHLQEEVGDLLLATVSLAIFCGVNPREALSNSSDKFQKRYDKLVALARKDGHEHLRGKTTEKLMHYWNCAKLDYDL